MIFANKHSFRPIFGDTDQMGVVYYANYLRYFEAGRNEVMRALGLPYAEVEKMGLGLPVAEVHVRYRAPARYDELLTLETRITQVRRSSIRIQYTLSRDSDGELLATGETVQACIGPSGRVERLPEVLLERLGVDGTRGA
jgi:acyl-CoA thioester hydrolase